MTATEAKDIWPRTKAGGIDWEVVFESTEQGLIPLIETADTPAKLRRCALVVIEQLFSRNGDTKTINNLQTSLDGLFSHAYGGGADIETTLNNHKTLITNFLRDIKVMRIERASLGKRGESEAAEPNLAVAAAQTPAPEPAKAKSAAYPDVGYADGIDGLFAEVFCSAMIDRFDVLRENIGKVPNGALPFPFFLSPEFTERYRRILLKRFIPHLIDQCTGIIRRAEKEKPEKQRDSLAKNFESRGNRENLWQAWQKIWSICTEDQEIPEKPAEEKKGLVGLFKKKIIDDDETTPIDEWEAAVKKIKADNETAAKTWAEITQPVVAYRAPTDADRNFLMSLFARTPVAIGKQINALRQIAEQGGNAARLFDDYRQGKDIDLPLATICYQRPDLFLGKHGLLKKFMRGYKDPQRQELLPLTTRYLSPFM